ncbi:hypothetical protein [Arthrobacter bambusae]|uniref:hypothetical protein n=1 Tax=Arthrobacter bambusae TaxID=1338426 RepID=UPI0027828DA3|nr:hypothetical protein [Arthrobacter bambusae]MDQ0030555.1 hypothetical protein [Arthrobacter bambusae]MDQ0098472.1 hypothetical protein [Arthrobacter bambusae]
MNVRRIRAVAAVLTGSIIALPFTLGAARAPESAPTELCVPLLVSCPTSTPGPGTPTQGPAPGPLPTVPGTQLPGLGSSPTGPAVPGVGSTASPDPTATPDPTSTAPVAAPRDGGTPVFTKTPASMGSQSLSFTGLSSVSIVTVPTADGSGQRALKITADSITINGFTLTVRHANGPGLVTSADKMVLSGHVSVYLGSVTGTTSSGRSLALGTDTPPPLDDVAPGLLKVTMGLVGATADSITYTNTDQRMVQP